VAGTLGMDGNMFKKGTLSTSNNNGCIMGV
jgi:hypothetical protein